MEKTPTTRPISSLSYYQCYLLRFMKILSCINVHVKQIYKTDQNVKLQANINLHTVPERKHFNFGATLFLLANNLYQINPSNFGGASRSKLFHGLKM